jgi:asparagine synthase (glutamine-hydrolysing)
MIESLNKQNAKELLKTFSYCSGVKGLDEKEFIDILANYYNIDSYYTYAPYEELFEVLDDLVWFQDEPFCSTSIYAQWNVFKLSAEKGVKVLLDGQGGDELLCGYGWFFIVLFAELFKKFRLFTLWREIRMAKELHSYDCLFVLRNMANVFLPRMIRRILKNWFGSESLTPGWMDLAILDAKPYDMNLKMNIITTSIKELSRSQLTASNLPMLLHWEDRNSMAHSVESRVPFLDYRLVEFVLGLPSDYIISEGMTKRVLRTGMRDILPSKILMRRDKIGFETPEQLWMRENSDKFMQALEESIIVSQGIIDPSALEGLNRILQGQAPYSSLVWRLVSFGCWVKKYTVSL